MDGLELLLLTACTPAALLGWSYWYFRTAVATGVGLRVSHRLPLFLAPLVSLGVLLAVLLTFASHDVRGDRFWITFYVAVGAAWLSGSVKLFTVVGIHPYVDALHGRNPAAAWAVGGGMVGVMLCFAGANIGDGPSVSVVIFSAGLSTSCFFGLWALHGWLGHSQEAVTIERDLPTGLRLAGWLVGSGFVLGRSVAGDWSSSEAAVHDLVRNAWPLLPLFAGVVAMERALTPRSGRPLHGAVDSGLLPGLALVGVCSIYAGLLGRW